jgi:mannose-6-phosphate isomerase-like protein (cupin superfamily)
LQRRTKLQRYKEKAQAGRGDSSQQLDYEGRIRPQGARNMQVQIELTEPQRFFAEQGFLAPFRVLTPEECAALSAKLQTAPAPLDWAKGHAATSEAYFRLATHPAIIERVVELIGEDVMLWGASLVRRRPGEIHTWHTDIETSADVEGTVSVWIGLENTRAESSLSWAPGSHRLGLSVQEKAYQNGKHREEVTAGDIAAWTKALGADGEILQPGSSDGEALLFDGRLWHSSHNTSPDGTRLAVLLQYARPDVPIWMPDLEQLEFPFRNLEHVRPPCVMVHGSVKTTANRIVPAPAGSQTAGSRIRQIDLPLAEDAVSGWASLSLLKGPTPCMTDLECHVSVLSAGRSPHEPHLHPEEEILVVLDGQAQLELVAADGTKRSHAVERGAFAYYPLGHAHTIRNTSAGPVTYLMFKWRGAGKAAQPGSLPATVLQRQSLTPQAAPSEGVGLGMVQAFGGTTAHLLRLRAHLSVLAPGGGYEPHVDPYDAGLVLLDGCVETQGQRVEAPAVIFHSAGDPHGLHNPGTAPASYLVFEFQGTASVTGSLPVAHRLLQRVPSRAAGLAPRWLKRLARRLLLGY